MYRTCIAIVDASRARVFRFDREIDAAGITREKLVELTDFVDPARRQRPSELFSDTRPGSGRSGGRQFAYDDHRDANLDHLDTEFAQAIVAELERTLQELGTHRIVVCAAPRMLGELRLAGLRQAGITIHELPRDLTRLTPSELREALADHGLLPPPPVRPTTAASFARR